MWAVLSHPDVKKRLLKEIEDAGLKNARFEDLRRLKYLNNVVEETLRMYPAAPGSLPRVSFEDALLGGYRIPKGTVVVTQAWTFHRDAATFPEPLQFEPSRWENATVEMQRAFIPWGGGARGTSPNPRRFRSNETTDKRSQYAWGRTSRECSCYLGRTFSSASVRMLRS